MSRPADPSSVQSAGEIHDAEEVGHGFGTFPVFVASTTTILGAILFLRMGYAVGHTGLIGSLGIILLGHMVTIPTALAVSEISTNRRVEGGGEYFMISRSFGRSIGATIGVSLFFSSAVSIAFYMAAFAESFTIFEPLFIEYLGFFDARLIAVPGAILLGLVLITKGGAVGFSVLAIVTSVQFIAIIFFFMGGTPEGVEVDGIPFFSDLDGRDTFMVVFAVCFTGFTGLTAGVGLSGDLKDPRKSIPRGILTSVFFSMIVYILVVIKIAVSVPLEMAAEDQLIIATISIWAPIVIFGLACSALTSALCSFLVAPRILQALGKDGFTPSEGFNRFVTRGEGAANDPRNATIVATLIAVVMVAVGSVDSIARIVSMFFMVTYGALCLISFLEHFAARPAYRPSFKSRWFVSLLGAVMCFMLMFLMDPFFATIAVLALVGLYLVIRRQRADVGDGVAALFEGVMAQATRYFQIRLHNNQLSDWRPSLIMISDRTFTHRMPRQFITWLSHRYGFATYIHYIQGTLNHETFSKGEAILDQLLSDPVLKESNLYVDTMISPSMVSALAQTLQVPGVSGVDNNMILFEFSLDDTPEFLAEVVRGCDLATISRLNRLVLRHGPTLFGNRREIHIWLTWHDNKNAGLMILLAYILLADPAWEDAEISIYAAYPEFEVAEKTEELYEMIEEGRVPIAPKNVVVISTTDKSDFQAIVEERSRHADLVILGFTPARLERLGADVFLRHDNLTDVLFMAAEEEIVIE